MNIDHAYESRNVLFRANNSTEKELFSDLVHFNYKSVVRALDSFHNLTLTLNEQFAKN